jgi:hypothetical protein
MPGAVFQSLPPMGKVDSAKNACIVSPKTDEVPDVGATPVLAKAMGAT